MRRVLLQMGISLDGFSAHPPVGGEHPDVEAWKIASLAEVGTHILGRVAYEELSAFWPSATGPFAEAMNTVPKVVFSSTLELAEWADSRIARGNLAEEIAHLKAEPGKDIMAHGGPTFVQALSQQGLIDEYRIVIRPVVLGDGAPLFAGLPEPLNLELVEATSYPDGIAIHVYRPVG